MLLPLVTFWPHWGDASWKPWKYVICDVPFTSNVHAISGWTLPQKTVRSGEKPEILKFNSLQFHFSVFNQLATLRLLQSALTQGYVCVLIGEIICSSFQGKTAYGFMLWWLFRLQTCEKQRGPTFQMRDLKSEIVDKGCFPKFKNTVATLRYSWVLNQNILTSSRT